MAEKWFREKYGYKLKVDNKLRFFGDTDTKKKVIRINVKKSKGIKRPGELLDTINHERLHAKFPQREDGKKFDHMVNRSDAHLSRSSKSKLLGLVKSKKIKHI